MKFICGPMATISHAAFRILVEKFGGVDEYFTEMINASSLLNMGPWEKYYIDSHPVPSKVVWQLTGNSVEKMTDAAAFLSTLDGIGIDVNMGCSAPDVYKTGAGIAWMTKPVEETRRMVRSVGDVIEKTEKRFSVKLRLGDDDFTDDGFFSFCDMLVENGVKLFTLHPRTKKEKLNRPPRYEYCKKLCERYKKDGIKIYLNGNINDEKSLDGAVKVCPEIDGIMISRACVQKPWIFSELKKNFSSDSFGLMREVEPETLAVENRFSVAGDVHFSDSVSGQKCGIKNEPVTVDMESLCLDFISDVERFQPKEFYKTRLQRFFTYFCMNFQFAHYAQTCFVNAAAKGNDFLREAIADFFKKCPEEKYKTLYI